MAGVAAKGVRTDRRLTQLAASSPLGEAILVRPSACSLTDQKAGKKRRLSLDRVLEHRWR